MTWQPIETAPKDGTRVLVSDGKRVCIAWWETSPDGFDDDQPCWMVFECQDYFYSVHLRDDDEKPTKWQPLPEA